MQIHKLVQNASLVVLIGAIALTSGCGNGGGGSYSTPEACFNAANDAIKKKDFKTFASCLSPDCQGMMGGSMAMMGMMSKMMSGLAAMGGEEAKKKAEAATAAIEKVMNDHGVKMGDKPPAELMAGGKPDAKALGKLVASVKDKPAFIADMMKAMEGMGDKAPSVDEGTLSDVKTTGDTATGTLTTAKNKGPISFKKIDGSWRIDNFMK